MDKKSDVEVNKGDNQQQVVTDKRILQWKDENQEENLQQ